MTKAALAHLERDDGPSSVARKQPSLRIRLAEHDHHLRRLIALVLRRDGHFIVEASDGARVLDVVASVLLDHRRHYDLIVSEQRLPGIQGLSALSALRTGGDETPFVLITADPDVKVQATLLGAVVLAQAANVEAIRRAVGDAGRASVL
jgi:CheY-like chemotaxis protein